MYRDFEIVGPVVGFLKSAVKQYATVTVRRLNGTCYAVSFGPVADLAVGQGRAQIRKGLRERAHLSSFGDTIAIECATFRSMVGEYRGAVSACGYPPSFRVQCQLTAGWGVDS